jgi:hypothetical protein
MKKTILSYEGYLTEPKLIQMFKELEKQCSQIKVEINKSISKEYKRYKGDIIINDYWLIEFDGYPHYTKSAVFERDDDKNYMWKDEQSKEVIRIPYFVQLTTETFNHYFKTLIDEFNLNIEIQSDYPHGFIDKKAILPADFCSVGERRFYKDIWNLPQNTFSDIINSLWNHLQDKTAVRVFSIYMRENKEFKWVIDKAKEFYPEDRFILFNAFYELRKQSKK